MFSHNLFKNFIKWFFSCLPYRDVPHNSLKMLKKNVWRSYNIRCQFHQHSTSNFYAPGDQKRKMTILTWLSFFAHSESTCVKAVRRMLMKLTSGLNFINMFTRRSYDQRSQKHKNAFNSSIYYCTFRICAHISFV